MLLATQIMIIVFLGVMAICAIVFPILYLSQRNKQHKEFMKWLKEYQHKD